MWRCYRVELYPQYPGAIAGFDRFGFPLPWPAFFRQARGAEDREKVLSAFCFEEIYTMIRSESEHESTLRQIAQLRAVEDTQRKAVLDAGGSANDADRVVEGVETMRRQLEDESEEFCRARRDEVDPIRRADRLGRLLIAARIATGRLNVS